jgi:hypothetical protein
MSSTRIKIIYGKKLFGINALLRLTTKHFGAQKKYKRNELSNS